AVDQTGTRLWKMDVSKRGAAGYTQLRDFKDVLGTHVYLMGLTTDVAGNTFSFYTRDLVTAKPLNAVIWVRNINKTYVLPANSHVVHESKVDKNGLNVMVNYDDNTMALWTFKTGAMQWFDINNLKDDAGGHSDIGAAFIVNSDVGYSGIASRTFSVLRPT